DGARPTGHPMNPSGRPAWAAPPRTIIHAAAPSRPAIRSNPPAAPAYSGKVWPGRRFRPAWIPAPEDSLTTMTWRAELTWPYASMVSEVAPRPGAMMASMPRDTARYDLISEFYLNVVGAELGNEPTAVALLDLMGGVRGTRVLDLACGHGRIARELARCGARVVGVDISDVLLNMARAAE